MLQIPELLNAAQVREFRRALEQASWADGRETAGPQAARAKRNLQLPTDSALGRQLGDAILDVLSRNPRFIAAALPLKVLPPRFNRYEGGGEYGTHIDAAIYSVPGTPHRIRSDLSATLFLSEPDEYDGGELTVQDDHGEHRIKLPAGHLALYPATSLHHVTPVTRGARYASFFWIQSLVRETSQRSLLLHLDQTIQNLGAKLPDDPDLVQLTGVYHNLLRQWSET